MPNFLIIGAPKSGTTSLAQYLGQHPQIYISPKKEPYFFAFENESVNFQSPYGADKVINQAVVSKMEAYQTLFQDVSHETAVGEASTLYLYFPKAAPRIKHHLPNAKLIAILRNPIDRAYSGFMHALRENQEPVNDFTVALSQEKERIDQNYGPLWRYQDQGFYYQQLKLYYDSFNPEQIKIYLYEDLQNNLPALLHDIFLFLDVDTTFKPDTSSRYNMTGIPQNKFLHYFLSNAHFAKSILKAFLPQRWLKDIAMSLNKANLVKPELSPLLRQQLIEVYREDITNLQELIEQDISHWLQ